MKFYFALCDLSQRHIDDLSIYVCGTDFYQLNYDECMQLLKFIANIQSLYVQHWIAHHES